MGSREQECWERFCRSGLVSDYLEYRSAVEFEKRGPEDGISPGVEGMKYADRDQGGGPQDQKPGGV